MSVTNIDYLNGRGFAAFLKDASVQELIESYTNEVKQRADACIAGESEGFRADVRMLNTRPVGFVGTTDYATMIAESENKALTKAVHG